MTAFKSTVAYNGPQALAQQSVSVALQAVLDMPEVQFMFDPTIRAGEQSRLSYRDRRTAGLIAGYGTGQLGSGINSLTTHKLDGTLSSRLLAPWLLPPSYTVFALWRMSVLPTFANDPLLCDASYVGGTTPDFAMGPTNSATFNARHATGSGLADTSITYAINTNYITAVSFDAGTSLLAISTNKRSVAASATISAAYPGATSLWIGSGNAHFLTGEIGAIIVTNFSAAIAGNAPQRDTVLNYLAPLAGITLGS